MRIVNGYPPNWEKIKATFPIEENPHVLITYGEEIFNPFNFPDIRPDLHFHESVHSWQQGRDPEGWWDKYIANVDFRVSQEIEAYGQQLRYIKNEKGEQKSALALASFSKFVSGPIYGNAITRKEAMRRLAQIMRT